MKNLVFVCTANTCRSPMAQAIFSSWLCERGIIDVCANSAGLYKGGEQVNDIALSVLKKHACNGTLTKPKVIDAALYAEADIVVTMTCEQARLLREKFADDGKIICICDIIGKDVIDPYGKGVEAYEKTFEILCNSCSDIYKVIKNRC